MNLDHIPFVYTHTRQHLPTSLEDIASKRLLRSLEDLRANLEDEDVSEGVR